MDYQVNVYMLNPHFSQEHADAQHGGEESAGNKKLDWQDEMRIKEITSEPEIERKAVYHLKGARGDNEFDFQIKEMFKVKFQTSQNQIVEIACSEELYESHQLEGDTLNLYLHGEPYANPVPGVYIASLDFPAELIQGD